MSHKTEIHRLAKSLCPECNLSAGAVTEFEKFVNSKYEEITRYAQKATLMAKQKTITLHAVETAAKLMVSTDFLREQVIMCIDRSVKAFMSFKGRKGVRVSDSEKAGLQLSVARAGVALRSDDNGFRVAQLAAVAAAAAVEQLAAEWLDVASGITKKYKRVVVTPRHMMLARETDAELAKVCPKVLGAGVEPKIHNVLLKKAKPSKRRKTKK